MIERIANVALVVTGALYLLFVLLNIWKILEIG